jgi:hypothetical protein
LSMNQIAAAINVYDPETFDAVSMATVRPYMESLLVSVKRTRRWRTSREPPRRPPARPCPGGREGGPSALARCAARRALVDVGRHTRPMRHSAVVRAERQRRARGERSHDDETLETGSIE